MRPQRITDLGLNGYSHKLGFFRDRVMPLCSYVIATEPLGRQQWDSIGWSNRQGISDQRILFNYQRPTVDGRIVIGGSDYPYFANDALAFNGHGVVLGYTAGRIISELVAGEQSELTDLFVVNHEIPWAGPRNLRALSARLYKWYLKQGSAKTTT